MSRRGNHGILAGRAVSTGSVYSTILSTTVIERSAPERRVELLVDVGCGDSAYRHVMEHDRYIGLDRLLRGRDAELVTADAAALPLAPGIAGGLLCTEVIEHVPDERALAAELARVAVADATLVVSAPFVHGLHEVPYDFRRLTSIGLVATLEGAGSQVDSLTAIGGPVVGVDGAVRWCDSLLRRAAGKLSRKGSTPHRMLAAPSAALQRRLAGVAQPEPASRSDRPDGAVASPHPRLRRRGDASGAAGRAGRTRRRVVQLPTATLTSSYLILRRRELMSDQVRRPRWWRGRT